MKTTSWIILLCMLSISASALNFFGIEHSGNTTDSIINLIYSLVEDDEPMVKEYIGRLEATAPGLLTLDDLKIPCSRCDGKGSFGEGEPCPVCEGAGLVMDKEALVYLQNKFCAAIDAGTPGDEAWKGAKDAFDKKRALVLNKENLYGTVIRREGTGLLMKFRGETIFLAGVNSPFAGAGKPINGQAWPNGTYSTAGEDGEPMEVKAYTTILWTD